MTKNDAKIILQCRGNGYSEDEFNDALEIVYDALSELSLPSNLDEAAENYSENENPTCPCGECLVNTFKAGAEWMAGQGVSLSHLIVWYIQSVDAHEPVWTKEHLEELVKDYILIPKK